MTCTTIEKKPQPPSRRSQVTPAKLRTRLERKLLAIGGKTVIWQGRDPQPAMIAAKGVEFNRPLKWKKGDPHRCHVNAAELWASGENGCRLVTGYALSLDRWVSHTWAVDDKNLYETTMRYDRYFGFELNPLMAVRFWIENACPAFNGEAPMPGPEFFNSRPAVVAGFDLMAELGKEECMRRLIAYDEGREP